MSTQARIAAEATFLSRPHDSRTDGAHPRTAASRLMIPREHGAWGLVSLPFLAGAVVAGGLGQRSDAGRAAGSVFCFPAAGAVAGPLAGCGKTQPHGDGKRASWTGRNATSAR